MSLIHPRHILSFFGILLAMVSVLPAEHAAALPVEDGLVLWLDAQDTQALSKQAGGAIQTWSDKSGQDNHAEQKSPENQPHWVADGMFGKPALHFDGDDYLNLGQPAGLDFKPGAPFTIAVVSRVAPKDYGTFFSKGGGKAGERAYQVYAAPGREGTITYGVMKEQPRLDEAEIIIAVCHGAKADVHVNGALGFSSGAGKAASTVDVLVGARREKPDNTGAYYMLKGDVAEIIVYNRALDTKERAALGEFLTAKHGLELFYAGADNVARLVGMLAAPEGRGKVDALAQRLSKIDKPVEPALRDFLAATPKAAPYVLDLLIALAQNNALSDPLAALTAEFLSHEDPFIRGMAEWALSMKIGGENNGQLAAWPKPDAPAWFTRWMNCTQEARVEADWVRQAVSRGIHHDAAALAASMDQMIARTERMWADRAAGAGPEELAGIDKGLERLRRIRERFGRQAARCGEDGPSPGQMTDLRRQWMKARRQQRTIALANQDIDFNEVVFVKQFAPHTVRNITRSYSWKHKPGGDICVLSGLNRGGTVRDVIQNRLGPGYVWGLDLWWDADRVVFSYAQQPEWPPAVDTAQYAVEGTNVYQLRQKHKPIHIFEAALDGSGLRQLTDHPYWSDFEPTYCANGDIIFASDRCARSAECGNDTYDHTNPNLYVLSADGSDVRQWTDSKDIDRYPHSLDDGRIVYTHWEYQERHFMEVHALWTARPDGTMSDALFKHHMSAPCGLRDARSVPGGNKLVAIATGHHTFAYGPVVLVDPTHGMNNKAGLAIVTPGVKPQEGPMAGAPVAEGGVPDKGGLYQTPWALSETCFLASYAYGRPKCTAPAGADSNGFGIYLIDAYGNRELLHRDPLLSCAFPIPLRKRPKPLILPGMVASADPKKTAEPAAHEEATCYVADVYQGMEGVPRGTVKYLRIAQHVGWPFDTERGQMDYIPGNAGSRRVDFQSWSPVRVIGTVPVEADGSANFKVPADTALYFQALDERHMEIRRMRSMVSLKAGEVRGCTGCHQSREVTPEARKTALAALRRKPSKPVAPSWGAEKLLGYEWLVQPILDRHCVRCHGAEEPDGGLNMTAARTKSGLYRSFRTLFGYGADGKKSGPVLVSCSDRFSNASVSQPKEFGSHKSPLVRVLLDDAMHRKEVKLSEEEWISLVTWVDANAPYHDAFVNKRPSDGGEPKREIAPRPLGPNFVISKN